MRRRRDSVNCWRRGSSRRDGGDPDDDADADALDRIVDRRREEPPPSFGPMGGARRSGENSGASPGNRRKRGKFGHEKPKDDEGVEIDPFDTRKRNQRTGGLRR